MRRDRIFLWIFLVVLAPLAAVVVVSALMLFGVHPQTVFAPGRLIRSLLGGPRGLAVASTVLLWWALFAAIGLAWEWRRARRT